MTLGGLALAVGILVDDATVEIENIHRNLVQKKPLVRAIMDGASQIAVPAFVSTLCICIVFVPVVFIAGSAKSLFVPMAMSVVFAMLMSYFLSRTVVPTLVHYLLPKEAEMHIKGEHATGPMARFYAGFERAFERLRAFYGGYLAWSLQHRGIVIGAFGALFVVSFGLYPLVGEDFFPSVDAGLIKLHVRGPAGTRIEETERRFTEYEDVIRAQFPPGEIATLIDNMGIPYSGINLSLSDGTLVSAADGEVMISLEEGHGPTAARVKAMRTALTKRFPDTTFFFTAPDISTQVLNFGLPAPIDLQLVGAVGNEAQTYALARSLADRVKNVPGAVDVRLAQVQDLPELRIDVDRTMANRLGLTQRDIASDVLVSLSSSGQVAPSYWVDKRGVQYIVAVQTPQRQIDSIEALDNTPVSTPSPNGGSGAPQLLSNLAQISRTSGVVNVTHFNAIRTFDVQANVEGADLGSVARGIDKIVDGMKKELPRGTTIKMKGQVESMRASFKGLAIGLVFAIMLVYFLMAVNFQSWVDPLVILMALPGALSGIAWMLFVTQTTLSVPALMGAIMCVGVATANSILVVTFANDQRAHDRDATQAALAAGITRLRPVIMTALAMIIGMLPMSLGLGEGGEQNAPLGRAVIGGLIMATFTTLFFVPIMYSLLRRKVKPVDQEVESL